MRQVRSVSSEHRVLGFAHLNHSVAPAARIRERTGASDLEQCECARSDSSSDTAKCSLREVEGVFGPADVHSVMCQDSKNPRTVQVVLGLAGELVRLKVVPLG